MNEALATHNQQLALELQNIKGELMAQKSECERILRERDADALALKRNQLRLARMRAMRS
ncbi:hypothetical protein E6Q11_06730 [Candidatus Dojkabacteria bacterium]|uniref:Uncharacterized protein n=1 Tax=Candidatus Dojkabacteria bacterium TaxID=2099670 RepID=A0A5C7J2N7_9BACT|nr:MAG: hypothetical protein E6Q11_06730 [Candidatus Dojkabacteria bacterium]